MKRGVLRSMPDAGEGSGAATRPSLAQSLQAVAVVCESRLSLANDVPRSASLVCRFPADLRWQEAGCGETMARDLRVGLRMALDRNEHPSAGIGDSRTLQSSPASGGRAGFEGHKKLKGSKLHAGVDTLDALLAPGPLVGDATDAGQGAGRGTRCRAGPRSSVRDRLEGGSGSC